MEEAMARVRRKAMKRNGTKRRWSDNSALPGHKRGDMLSRHAYARSLKIDLESLTAPTFRKLAHNALNQDSLRQPLPRDSGAYPRQVVKEKIRAMKEEAPPQYKYLWLRKGEGYMEALVFQDGVKGFRYCLYDNERGSFVSEYTYTDRKLFQLERESDNVRLRHVTTKEFHFVIADHARV